MKGEHMAAANMKAVKLRIKSVQNTMQITKAMQLVAASKLRKAKQKADQSKPYFEALHRTLTDIAWSNTEFQSRYTKAGKNDKWLYIVIAGDRGLAGGYNANLFKFMEEETKGQDYTVLPIGKKSVDYFHHKKAPILTEAFAEVASIGASDCFEISRLICEEYAKGTFGHISMCYTDFVSMMTQTPGVTSMLPLSDFTKSEGNRLAETGKSPSGASGAEKKAEDAGKPEGSKNLILYEPDSETVFDAIVPDYLAGLLYSSINVSVASELAARRTAMEAATDNAEEMIDTLSLNYNRARQASITQEITEIVAGAEGA